MIVNAVCQFPVVVEDEPSSLPSLGPVDGVGKVPVRSHEQVSTLGDLSARLVELYGRGRVILLESETVGAFALVEYVWCKFSALHICHVEANVSRELGEKAGERSVGRALQGCCLCLASK